MLCKPLKSAAGWSLVGRKGKPRPSKMCLYVYQNQSLSHPSRKMSNVVSPHQETVSNHSSCIRGFSQSYREPGNKNGPSGLSLFKAYSLPCQPVIGCWLSLERHKTLGEAASFSWHGFPKSNSSESLQPQTTPADGGLGSGSTVSTGALLSSMSGAMFAIVFPPQRNGLALNGSYSGQLAFCWWFQQELFQRSVGRREESR